jgi:hypothetical protein
LGPNLPAKDAGADALRATIERSRQNLSGLAALAAQRRGGLQVSIRLAWGTGRASFRSGASWRYSDTIEVVPGFMAGLEIHR